MKDPKILENDGLSLKASSPKLLMRHLKFRRLLHLKHLKPRRLLDRADLFLYELLHPHHPWLTKQANTLLSTLLRPTYVGLEWGSGRSTFWFAQRLKHLTSVEHDKAWYEAVSAKLKALNIQNVDYVFGELDMEHVNLNSPYFTIVDSFNNNSLDFVLVDGYYRDICVNKVLDKIRPNGILAVDQANWSIPSDSRSPRSIPKNSAPVSKDWELFLSRVKDWRLIWTSNGIVDTAIWLKPA